MPAAVRERLVALVEGTGVDVSRETIARLERHVSLLHAWQAAQNLVAPATLPEVWTRHVLDSAQVVPLAGDAVRFADLGSGAGFPGLVVAALLADRPGAIVHLVESNRRKAAFLAAVARETAVPVAVHARRIEGAVPAATGPIDVVLARALAPLETLLVWSEPALADGGRALVHKGAGADAEIAEAAHTFAFDLVRHPSVCDPKGRILEIRALARRSERGSGRAPSD